MVKPSKRSSSYTPMEKSKFEVFDFDAEDHRVWKDSKKIVSKFKSKNAKELSTSPVNKYSFLQCFARGTETVENVLRDEPLDVETYYHDKEERIHKLGATVSCSSDRGELPHSPTDIPEVACSFPGEISCTRKGRKLGRCGTDEKHNQPLFIDSDDEQGMKESLNSMPISVDSDDDLSSVKEWPPNDNSNALHSEATVVVKPDCIFLGDTYSTASTLTFSRKSIKLEGSIVDQTNRSFDFTWSISDIVKIKCLWCREIETAMVYLHLKPVEQKVAEIDGRFSEKAGPVQLSFSLNDPRWCERQKAIELLDSRYKATLDNVLHIDLIWSEFSSPQQKSLYFSDNSSANEVFEDIIYPTGDPDAVSITKKDVELLQPATFINDTIIDFYIKYLGQNIKPDQKLRFHFFNSFFFRKLADLDKDLSTACEGTAAFLRVRKWTRKVNLFEKDFLFVPVNFSLHWSLIVICHPGEAACYRNEGREKSSKVPCILHMDSIRGYHRGLNNLFQSYLWAEWKERHDDTSSDVYANFLNLPFISLELPQQENSFDCGLFLLYYVECFLQQAPLHFSPFSDASHFLNKEWFQPAKASNRRSYIKSLIYQIYHENAEIHLQDVDEVSSDIVVEEHDRREARQTDSSALNAKKQIQIEAEAATPVRSLSYLGGQKFIRRDKSGEKSEGTHQHQEKMRLLDWRCNLMSPIEEEEESGEQRAFLSTHKTSDRNAGATVSGVCMDLDYEDVEIFVSKPQISADLVLICEKRNQKNEKSWLSDDELECCVVEDSQDESGMIVIDDDADSRDCRVRRIDLCDLENDCSCSTRYEKADQTEAVEASEVEQDLKNLSCLGSHHERRFKRTPSKGLHH